MNDRFKFRAYNKELRKMYEVDTICPYEDNYTKGGEVFLKGIQYNSFYFPEEVEVMQCTGLKDKNGKLIYELDYVRYANNKYKVEIDKFFGISLTNILNGDTIVMDDIVLFNCEVIGNEFESNTKI